MLFGHEKGAFTGALKNYSGVFEQAAGGTLFLDEIGEMPIRLQAKLLRVLQERQLTRLGAQTQVNVDVRLVAATNRDLKAAIESRDFREDLYFRISKFRLRLPCLAERPLDIMPLAQLMLDTHGAERRPWTIAADAEALLRTYAWPGNVRELSNVMQRALVLSHSSLITAAHLSFDEFGVLDNSKPNADLLLKGLLERISASSRFASVLVVRKPNAALCAPREVLDQLAEGADLVFSAMGD